MTTVTFNKKNDVIDSFEVRGHANLSTYGKDIVCSAISSTTLMTLNSLVEVLKLDIEYIAEDGYIKCNLKGIKSEKAQFMLESYLIFIEELATQYPKNLKFKVMEV